MPLKSARTSTSSSDGGRSRSRANLAASRRDDPERARLVGHAPTFLCGDWRRYNEAPRRTSTSPLLFAPSVIRAPARPDVLAVARARGRRRLAAMSGADYIRRACVFFVARGDARRCGRVGAHHPFPRFGAANPSRCLRVALVAGVAGAASARRRRPHRAGWRSRRSLVVAALDGVDGWLARRDGRPERVRRALRHGDRRAADPGPVGARLAAREGRVVGAGVRPDALRLRRRRLGAAVDGAVRCARRCAARASPSGSSSGSGSPCCRSCLRRSATCRRHHSGDAGVVVRLGHRVAAAPGRHASAVSVSGLSLRGRRKTPREKAP